MRRVLGALTIALVSGLPAVASAAGLDVRIGAFFPRASSNLFHDDFDLYNVGRNDFIGIAGGIEINTRLARFLELGFHADGYDRKIRTSYRDAVSGGHNIRQTLMLAIAPVGVSLRLVPTGHRARFAPYLAAGVDVLFWSYEERGDFIDFQDPGHPIIPDHFRSDGAVPGFHVAGGLRVPLNHDFSVVGEVRYQWAKEKDMGGDFRSADRNQLDLSGATATLGLHIAF